MTTAAATARTPLSSNNTTASQPTLSTSAIQLGFNWRVPHVRIAQSRTDGAPDPFLTCSALAYTASTPILFPRSAVYNTAMATCASLVFGDGKSTH